MKKPKIIIVLPAYNAEKTLLKTFREIPKRFAYKIILVDDNSQDNTVKLARKLGMIVFEHPNNLGYGGNQKTCYWEALKLKPDIVVMLHPDYQYDASLLGELVKPILDRRFDYMFGSRVRQRKEALAGGMPAHKYIFNRLYTAFANIVLGVNLSEHMSGLRAYSVKTLKIIPFQRFSNDFVFDQQFTISAVAAGLKIGEIPIPTRYYSDSSSIGLWKGLKFGLESLYCLALYLLFLEGVHMSKIFAKTKRAARK